MLWTSFGRAVGDKSNLATCSCRLAPCSTVCSLRGGPVLGRAGGDMVFLAKRFVYNDFGSTRCFNLWPWVVAPPVRQLLSATAGGQPSPCTWPQCRGHRRCHTCVAGGSADLLGLADFFHVLFSDAATVSIPQCLAHDIYHPPGRFVCTGGGCGIYVGSGTPCFG